MVTENHVIYQNTFNEKKEVEPVEPVQLNIFQSNTYRKVLRWLHFNDQPKVQERQQVKDQESCLSVFVAYLTIPSSNQKHQPRFHTWAYVRFIEIQSNPRRKKPYITNQGSNFLGGSFNNKDNVRGPIQFRRELSIFKDDFSNPSIFTSIAPTIRPAKQNQQSFSCIEINMPITAPVLSVLQIRFKFRSHFQLLPEIRCLIALRIDSTINSLDSNITDNIIRKIINVQQEKCRTKNGPLRNSSINQIFL